MMDHEIAELLRNAPKTVDDAVEKLFNDMKESDIKTWEKLEKDDLINFHHTLGRWIRNNFGLWCGNDELMKDTGETHADEASFIIIEKLYAKINAPDPS